MSVRDISFGGNRMLVLLGSEAGAGVTVLDETVPPDMSPPPHAHLRASETFFVLDGSYGFVVDGERHEIEVGDLVSVPAGTTHWWTAGPEGARSLIIFAPGGMEGYFAELRDALAAAGEEPLDAAFHATMRDRYGTEIRR